MTRLLRTCQDLLAHQLSVRSGGDRGMIFDEFDAAEERKRRGHVVFDQDAVDRFRAAVKAEEEP